MLQLSRSLALCTIFIFLTIFMLLFIAVLYICKYHFEQIEMQKVAISMRPEEVDKCAPKKSIDEEDFISDIELPYYSSCNLPQIMLENEELPPEYFELESARASPLPSYDDVIYCDQLNRSFQNLISPR